MTYKLVSAKEIDNIEDYATSLLSMTLTLKTLEAYHITALQKGLLDDDEKECAETIIWEIRKLMSCYQNQMKNVLDRINFDQEKVLKDLKRQYPEIKLPRKKRTKKEIAESSGESV